MVQISTFWRFYWIFPFGYERTGDDLQKDAALLFGKAGNWEKDIKARPPHGAIVCVDLVPCQWSICDVSDPSDGLFLVVCKFLSKGSVWGKADS
jgi:hypothetical protein